MLLLLYLAEMVLRHSLSGELCLWAWGSGKFRTNDSLSAPCLFEMSDLRGGFNLGLLGLAGEKKGVGRYVLLYLLR